MFSEADLRRGRLAHSHILPHPYRGTNHVLFNGTLYYHRAGTPMLAKFDLASKRYEELLIAAGMAYRGDNVN